MRGWKEDPIRHALTLMVHVRASGEAHGVVALRNTSTGRYSFVELETLSGCDVSRQGLATAGLRYAFEIVDDVREGAY